MFTCHVCGHTAARSEFMSEVFMIDGQRVLVEHIPAQVCQRCGEALPFRAKLRRRSAGSCEERVSRSRR